ncbi:MAG: branched-chain amino acid ABC transporter permease, partial [Dehalococcoidia bacterium]|nr:branched-chain amino acid ABC transporter permease [Dehalococcoidia bacterium]
MRPSGIFNTSYNQDMAIIRTNLQWVLFIALIVALFALPLLYQGYWIGFLVFVGISAITALGLMLLSGYCGQISLGHSAFMGVGGFTAALLVF